MCMLDGPNRLSALRKQRSFLACLAHGSEPHRIRVPHYCVRLISYRCRVAEAKKKQEQALQAPTSPLTLTPTLLVMKREDGTRLPTTTPGIVQPKLGCRLVKRRIL